MKKLSSVLKWLGVVTLGLIIIPIITILILGPTLKGLDEIFNTIKGLNIFYLQDDVIIMLSSLSVLYVGFKRFKADTHRDVGLRCAVGVNVLILIFIICSFLYRCTSIFKEYLEPIGFYFELVELVELFWGYGIVICNEVCKGTFKRYKERRKSFWGVVLSIFIGIAVIIISGLIAELCSDLKNGDMSGYLIDYIIPIRVYLMLLLSLCLCMFVYNVYKFNKRDKVVKELPTVQIKGDNIAIEENCDLDIR